MYLLATVSAANSNDQSWYWRSDSFCGISLDVVLADLPTSASAHLLKFVLEPSQLFLKLSNTLPIKFLFCLIYPSVVSVVCNQGPWIINVSISHSPLLTKETLNYWTEFNFHWIGSSVARFQKPLKILVDHSVFYFSWNGPLWIFLALFPLTISPISMASANIPIKMTL